MLNFDGSPIITVKKLLGFQPTLNPGQFRALPQMSFKPRGLMLWNIEPGTMLRQCVISLQEQVLVSTDPVPAQFFTMAQSYEQVAKAIEQGSEPPSWCDFQAVQPGCSITLEFTGNRIDHIQAAMWGEAVQY